MEVAAFWKLIDATREAAGGDAEQQIDLIENRLAALPEADIVDFGRLFDYLWARAYTWPLWGAAFLLGGGCSDDGFMDFRGWLITRGQGAYERALEDPDSLAAVVEDGENGQLEGFHYVALQAWERSTGRPAKEFPAHAVTQAAVPSGEKWDEDDLERLYPRLARKVGL